MKKHHDMCSFPSLKEKSGQQENNVEDIDEQPNSVLNLSFLESLDDFTRFSYASLCATVLHLLYDSSDERDFRHSFATSFATHLSLPTNVSTTMEAISDGHGVQTTELFIDSLSKNETIKNDSLLLANDMVLWALTSSQGQYDARTRCTIRHVLWKMHITYEDLEKVEEKLIEMLRESTEKEKLEQEAVRAKKAKSRKWKRYALIGVATAGGGALIGLTGGLAAPLVAAGAGAILGGASAAALGSVAGIAVITSLFGAAGAGLTGYKMKRRVGGIDEFLFKPLTVAVQPSITIAVSGWLSDDGEDGFMVPWKNMLNSKEQYSLIWESKHLKRLGKAFKYILDGIMSMAATEVLKYTVLAGLITAVAWPASLVSAAGVIDNPWSVCVQRAAQVGKQLAEVLLSREHGHRPVTLIGYSLGARVIYHCLQEMSSRKNHQGIVEDVYMLGAPVTGKKEDWEKLSSVIAGHVTNGYCRSDWLLKFLYRTSSVQAKVAGLAPIEWENRRMINIDLSSVIDGHLDYAKNMDTVLSTIGVRTKHTKKPAETKKSSSLPTLATYTLTCSTPSSKSDSHLVQASDDVTNVADEPTQTQSACADTTNTSADEPTQTQSACADTTNTSADEPTQTQYACAYTTNAVELTQSQSVSADATNVVADESTQTQPACADATTVADEPTQSQPACADATTIADEPTQSQSACADATIVVADESTQSQTTRADTTTDSRQLNQ